MNSVALKAAASSKRGRRRWWVAALASVVALVGFDLAVTAFVLPRYWRPLPPFGALTNAAQEAWLLRQQAEAAGVHASGIGRFDAELGWAYRPRAVSDDGRYVINSRGWRGAEPRAAREGELVVAAFGDSFTFCEEVGEDATWEAQLQERLPDVVVLNLGVGGYGTDQALLRARRELPSLGADVVLVGLLLENIGRNVNRYRPLWYPNADSPAAKPRFLLEDDGLELLPIPYRSRDELVQAVDTGAVLDDLADHEYWARRYVPGLLANSSLARLVAGRRAYAERELPRLWSDVDGEPFRTTVALLEAFAELGRAQGAGVTAVVLFPTGDDLERALDSDSRYWDGLQGALAERGIPLLDIGAALLDAIRAGDGSLASFYGASHLSRSGNGTVARMLDRWLRGRFPEHGNDDG